jgi:hypothetical protein
MTTPVRPTLDQLLRAHAARMAEVQKQFALLVKQAQGR